MATQVAEIPERILPAGLKGYRKYNLDQYMGGEAWKFTKGEDFHCRPGSFASQLSRHAKNMGLKCACRIRGQHCFFQVMGRVKETA